MDAISEVSEELAEIEGQINHLFRGLSDGFQKLEKMKDASRQSRQLEELTDKMRDYFDSEVKSLESGKDANTNRMLNDRRHSMVRIAVVGKYTCLSDVYFSVLKALLHASVACRKKLVVDWVPASDLEKKTEKENPDAYKAAWKLLKGVDGILVPGGFGYRGVEGKNCRENQIPFLRICLGMHVAVIEFARSILCLHNANSTEFKHETKHPCIIFMPEGSRTHMGGTMRLGSRKSFFNVKDSKSAKLYGNRNFVDERHRHRYEVNPDMVDV